jgi:hypothetical protein
MKLIKTFEYLTLVCLVTLMSLLIYGFALGADTTGTTGTGTTTTNCTTAPQIIQPAVNGSIPAITALNPIVTAPCSIGAYYEITNLTGPQPSARSMSMATSGDRITFPIVPVTTLYNGRYNIMVTVYYPTGMGNRIIGGTADPKMFDVKTGIPVTATTTTPTSGTASIPPTNTTTGTTTYPSTTTTAPTGTTTQNTTIINPSTATLMVNGKALTGAELQNYISTTMQTVDAAKLAPELKTAPVSVALVTEKAEVVSMNTEKTKGRVRLTGKGEPNTTLYLYIYSEPIVVSVKTDSNGNWNYSLDKDLESGKHEVYVAVKNTDGSVQAKSLPYSFFVGEAVAAAGGQTTSPKSTSPNYALYYLAIALSVVALVVSGIFYFVTRSHIKKHNEVTQN